MPLIKLRFLYLFIVSTLLVSCLAHSHGNNEIKRTRVSWIMPVKIFDGKGITDTMSIFTSYYDKYTLFELPYHTTLEDAHKIIYDSLKWEYFIYNSNKDFGYLLRSLSDTFKDQIKCDSIFKRAFNGGKGNENIQTDTTIMSYASIKNEDGQMIYRYLFKNDFQDSAYLFFDKNYNDIKFSFSKFQDSAYNSKLVKMMFFVKHDSISETNINLKGFFVNTFEMKKEQAKNEKELRGLFDRFIEFDKKGTDK